MPRAAYCATTTYEDQSAPALSEVQPSWIRLATPGTLPPVRLRHVLLLLILALAAFLRFSGIGWGLRHVPDPDERVFVERTRDMLERGSYDPGWYEYPGFMFVVLRGVLGAAPAEAREGAQAYVLARGLVAAAGVLSVALAFLLGRRLLGERAGLLAALWLALSPVEVQAAHMVRPDVVLGACAMLALLAFTRLGPGLRDDALAGLALGACAATKFTGAAMTPAFLAARALAPGRRLRGLLLGGACAGLVLAAATPRFVTDPETLLQGARTQSGYMYDAEKEASRGASPAAYYAGRYVRSLGSLGAALALAGLAAVLRAPAGFVPALVYSAGLLVVLVSAEARFERLIVSTLGVAALLAVRGLGLVASRWPRASLVLAGIAVLPPGLESLDYVLALRQPLTKDAALDFVEGELSRGARIVSGVPDLGTSRLQYDIAVWSGTAGLDRLALGRADAVIAFAGDRRLEGAGLEMLLHALPATPWSGPPVVVLRAPEARRVRFSGLDPQGLALRSTASPRGGLASVEIELGAPHEAACVELRFETGGGPPVRRLRLELRAEGEAFEPVPSFVGWSCGAPARPGERRRALVFETKRVRAVRVELDRDNRLSLADARLYQIASR